MIEAYGQALGFLFQPVTLLMITGAVIIGLIIGIVPGIGGPVGMVLLLPFVFRLPAEVALSFLVALYAATPTGGSITSILINVPGTGVNVATVLDGFPMNQKGEGARAIGAAVTASLFGGMVPCFFALAMLPLALLLVMNFRSPEMVMLALLGLSFMAALTGRSVIKGVISGALGVLTSVVGIQLVSGEHRFTFGSLFLDSGLGMTEVILGLFGLAEMFEMVTKGQTTLAIGKVKSRLSDVLQGARDVFTHRWLWLRSAIIGYVVGVIPAIGGSTASFVAYAQAKQTSKNPEKFGTGCVEGVIGPESANNAVEAGALLTTMTLGIPGSVTMAILIGAFVMVGVVPGPRMMTDRLPLALTLLLGLALANVIGGLICIFTSPYLGRLASINLDFVFPVTLMLILAGSFVVRGAAASLSVTIIFGVVGLIMKRCDFSRPALILGLVLGRLIEDYTLLSFQIAGPLFFLTPISLVMLAVIVIVFCLPLLNRGFASLSKRRSRPA